MHERIDPDNAPTYLSVVITNKGTLPVLIPLSFFSWKLPFARDAYLVTPWDYGAQDPWIAQKRYPIEIKPRASEHFFLSNVETFRELVPRFLTRKRLFKWTRLRFLGARVFTEDNKTFKVKLDKTVREEIRTDLLAAKQTLEQ
jgi:hypothetical protein